MSKLTKDIEQFLSACVECFTCFYPRLKSDEIHFDDVENLDSKVIFYKKKFWRITLSKDGKYYYLVNYK